MRLRNPPHPLGRPRRAFVGAGLVGSTHRWSAGSIADDCDGDEFIRSAATVINGGSWAPIAANYRTGPTSTSVHHSAQERRESNDTGPNSGRIQISGDHRLQGASSPPNRRLMLPGENRDLARIAR